MKKITTLDEIAHQVMVEKGFIPDFSKPIEIQLESFDRPAASPVVTRDMRQLLWVSIDNEDSHDLDQLTYAENDHIFIAVADVDELVKKGSPIDDRAANNTTSVYTPTKVFPMLPLKLSTNLTSLNENVDRCAIVIEMKISPNGKFDLVDIYHALVQNHAKLNYPSVGAWLEGHVQKKTFHLLPKLQEQLHLQDQLSQKIQEYRNNQGALEFAELKLQPVVINGVAVDLVEQSRNRAHRLIENYMIAANVGATRFLIKRKFPSIRRSVKNPKRWDRIVKLAKDLGWDLPSNPNAKKLREFLLHQQKAAPLLFPDLSLAIIKLLGRGEYVLGQPSKKSPGHFDLAEHEYSHTTAPNRRFPDLIMQRLLKKALKNESPAYNNEELSALAVHCTKKEDDANKVERRLIKCAAAMVLEKQLGHTFRAMVIGAAPKGTWVRLQSGPPVEGKLTQGFQNLDVGDFITVKLTHVDVLKGHIDFSRV